MTAVAAFFFAANGTIDWLLFAAIAIGTTCIVASGCVFNNYLDRGIDKVMLRTQKRSLAAGDIPNMHALVYATVLSIIGFAWLILFTNIITVLLGLIGIIGYVLVYGWAKRNTVHSTLIGSIPGATSLTAGYTAVTGSFDLIALQLFIVMVCWQMPHFYAIGIYRRKDYAAAALPILSVKKGIAATRQETLLYMIAFAIATFGLFIVADMSYTYLIVIALCNIWWLRVAIQGFSTKAGKATITWAHKIFGISLLILMLFSALIAFNYWLP